MVDMGMRHENMFDAENFARCERGDITKVEQDGMSFEQRINEKHGVAESAIHKGWMK